MKTDSFTFNGTTFYYDEVGEGDALVFIHAGICDRRMWDGQMDGLAERFRSIRYDMRGYGETAVVDTIYSHLEDLAALFDHWQLDAAHLVGCSKGGTLALDFALTHPEKIKSVTMVCSNPSGYQFEGEIPPQWHAITAAFKAGDIEKTIELEIQFWVDGWEHRPPGAAPEAVREQVRQMQRIIFENELKGVGEERPSSIKAIDHLATIPFPMLLIDGKYDDDDIGKALAHIQQQVPHAQLKILEAAHLPNMEQPEAFNHLLRSFYDTNFTK